jgi:hypothetical protein
MMNKIYMLIIFFLLTLSMATANAEEMPFIFSKDYESIADFSSDQMEDISASNENLKGIPADMSQSNGRKDMLERVEPRNSIVRQEAALLAEMYPGDHNIEQICSIFGHLRNGNGTIKKWSYINDPRGSNYYEYANESILLGKAGGYSGTGDCDDFAILMSALVESIGGTTRIVIASHDNGDSGHAFTEVYLGQDDKQGCMVERIISWLMDKYNTNEIYTHIDPDTKDVWLNLDWSADHPGGGYYKADEYTAYFIGDQYKKTSLKLTGTSSTATGNLDIIVNGSDVYGNFAGGIGGIHHHACKYTISLAGRDLSKVVTAKYYVCSSEPKDNLGNGALICDTLYPTTSSNNFSITTVKDYDDFSCRATITTNDGKTVEKRWPAST